MAVINNPNNWHWTDKNCITWARKYFEEHLIGLNTGSDEKAHYCEVTSISSMEGDCEVNQRKGKVISLFDLNIVMMIRGQVDDESFEGSISVPEVAFDSAIDDYQFDISIYKETSKLNEIKPKIRENLIPQLRDKFFQFGKDLLVTHGSDILLPEDQVNSSYTKQNQEKSFANSSSSKKQAQAQTSQISNDVKDSASTSNTKKETTTITSNSGNTASIHLEPSFNVPASELYRTFLEKQRVMAWSRSMIRYPSGENSSSKDLSIGEKFELFGGNVTSELVESKLNQKLVFNWRLNDWRSGNTSRLELEFHESKEYHETKVKVSWTGIPIGEEDRVRANFEEYYVRSIKITFGFGAVL
ncbi:Aha1p NDAI_0C04850 [Naumovozyma dairenensis CBS 421]|uniref:Activator of Hsp90 ATPase AHSA1-like N-terminal domain-containing protein n=1 Tax=Naumovozyma dairenensis (strain ATCC 10597 / BCRC 20456 / CBS 421 / NBRC 0211 / NRRL Y-12639) TaxID=1071378 RepID=G0W8N3_NAUDC|nr:hypothetical protein NDAI_0C04850 [Naumovozyma dairenensis CBS 421]CCD24144.1 hypothetical protein NDAI_0C04850 [Naumovozyma dairenensis CBS 421]